MSPTEEWHYWLWENEPATHVDSPVLYPSLEEAREAALELGRPVDILRTPNPKTAMGEHVETVIPQEK